ncbi:MAG: heme biosynthesis protein HemY [Rhodobacteraceae bacterium]|nr:heme biosynthesis protein HemY [Paracoccaceae bacterium]
MLWPLLKIVLFVAAIAAVTLGIVFVTESDLHMRMALAGYEFTLTPLAAAIALVLLLVGLWLLLMVLGFLWAFLRFLRGDDTALTRYFDRSRERKGLAALEDGLLALAAGEGQLARDKAARAQRYLGRADLTLLLSAQGAEMAGDTEGAIEAYKELVATDRTRFVGVKGLMQLKLAQGDTERALALAEKAFALKPRHVAVQDTLFRLQSRKEDWAGARRTLEAKFKARGLPRDVHSRRDAVLALAEAREAIAAGGLEAGRKAALEASRLSPQLVPAAVLAAEMHVAAGSPRKAAKVIKAAWEAAPHPDLAAAFAAIAPGETPSERRKRFAPLLKLLPNDPETRMLEAELALADEDFPGARRALGDVAAGAAGARALTIMAAVARGEGAPDRVVRGWLARALSAPRGPQWTCEACNHIHSRWVAICENCEAFDSLTWRAPPADERPAMSATDMLPLIVGAPDPVPAPPEEDDYLDGDSEPAGPDAAAEAAAPDTPIADGATGEPDEGHPRPEAPRP